MEALIASTGIVGTIVAVIFGVLVFFMPFFIYGTNMRTRQTALALRETNLLLIQIRDELEDQSRQE